MKATIPMDLMCILCPEMIHYKYLPRKKKKALKKRAEAMVVETAYAYAAKIIKAHEDDRLTVTEEEVMKELEK